MPLAEPALFRRFPELKRLVPHHPFLAGPTPVESLCLDGVPGTERVFVKRDERSTPLYGGNKPRKLEFLIGDAERRGTRRLITSGGLGTNHGLATTVLARHVGLRTTLILVDQPVTPSVRASLRLFDAFGADVVDGRTIAGAAWRGGRALAASVLRGDRPVIVPTGGSSARGNLGFVSAALELDEQIRNGLLPEPAEIYTAVGTGGTAVGLTVGLRLAGLRSRVVGVLVTDILPPSPRRLLRMARATLRGLRRSLPELPEVPLDLADFALAPDQLGAGYGATTPAAEAARERAAEAGLRLETTYTAKCLAELLARSDSGRLPAEPVLFWNTYNDVDVARDAPTHEGTRLPPRLAALVEEES